MAGNQTVWESDNQGVKETFIQTGRRGSDGMPEQQVCGTRQQLSDWDIPHSHEDKLGGTTGE